MKIAILGWGSLIWEQGDLLIIGKWQTGGPKLPIEFSRISDKRSRALTLVINPDFGELVSTRFAISKRKNLDDVICDLRIREGTLVKYIGFVNLLDGTERSNVYPEASHIIRKWALNMDYDAVVWTDLPSNFQKEIQKPFSILEAVNYLQALPEDGARKAREYIDKAPTEINTPLRKKLSDISWLTNSIKK